MKVDPHAQLAERAAAERVRVNMSWLLALRRAAVLGQTVTILVAAEWLDVPLDLIPLLALVALGLVANVLLQLWFVLTKQHEGDRIWLERGRSLLGSVLLLDLGLLTGLLYYTGGATNPFVVFFFVNLALATVMVSGAWLGVLYATAAGCYVFLLLENRPLYVPGAPTMRFVDPSASWVGEELGLYAVGGLVAFLAVAGLTAYFVRRLNAELSQRDAQLALERQRRADTERLEALARLAAGAAHELASPLSTIAVVARELERELEGAPPEVVEDARLVRDEVARCRRILDQMSLDAGAEVGEEMVSATPRELLTEAIAKLPGHDRVDVRGDDEAFDFELRVPRTALRRSLRALVKNALEASPSGARVDVEVRREGDGVAFEVTDRGSGMDPETLFRAGDPFFTTKDPGRGMGLGLFLVRTLAERLDGSFVLVSRPDAGTRAVFVLPRPSVGDDSGDDERSEGRARRV
ncbi:MAG: ATP-binding protein [Planctomycetota bacterium]